MVSRSWPESRRNLPCPVAIGTKSSCGLRERGDRVWSQRQRCSPAPLPPLDITRSLSPHSPLRFSGAPTWTQTRVSTDPLYSAGDDIDILVALNDEAYTEGHRSEVRKGGVVLHDPSVQPAEGSEQRSISIPFDEMAKRTGETRSANMVLMGALAYLVNMPQEYLRTFVETRFKGRDAIIKANLMALEPGPRARGQRAVHRRSGDSQQATLQPDPHQR